jgi:OST-HTH/LOTUS domain
VANHITRVEPSFSVKDYGSSKLIDLARSQPYLEVEQPADGSARVRLVATARTAKKTTRKRTTKKSAAQGS